MLLVGVLATVWIFTAFLAPETVYRLTLEGGFIEDGSVYGYFACILLILLSGRRDQLRESIFLCLPPLLLAMRELDFHGRFTTMGIFKTKYYVSPEVPLLEKLIVIFCLAVIVWAGVRFIMRFSRRFIVALRAWHPGAVSIVLAFILLAISKSVDGADRKAIELGIGASDQIIIFFHTLEEVFEFGGPLFLVLAALTRFHPQLHTTGSRLAGRT